MQFNLKISTFLIMLLISISSCDSGKLCPQTDSNFPANIVSITGPASLNVGEAGIVTIQVLNPEHKCISRIEGYIKSKLADTFILAATAYYIDSPDCGTCSTDDVPEGHIYFTPETNGNYYFSIEKSVGSNWDPSSVAPAYKIEVP